MSSTVEENSPLNEKGGPGKLERKSRQDIWHKKSNENFQFLKELVSRELKCESVDLLCGTSIPIQENQRKKPTAMASTCSLQPRWPGRELHWPRRWHHRKNACKCCPKNCYFCLCGGQVSQLLVCLPHFNIQAPQGRGLPPGYKCTLS